MELKTGRAFGDHLVQALQTGGLEICFDTLLFVYILITTDIGRMFTLYFSTFCTTSYHEIQLHSFTSSAWPFKSFEYEISDFGPTHFYPLWQPNTSSLFLWYPILLLTYSNQVFIPSSTDVSKWPVTSTLLHPVPNSNLKPSALIFRTIICWFSSYFFGLFFPTFFADSSSYPRPLNTLGAPRCSSLPVSFFNQLLPPWWPCTGSWPYGLSPCWHFLSVYHQPTWLSSWSMQLKLKANSQFLPQLSW